MARFVPLILGSLLWLSLSHAAEPTLNLENGPEAASLLAEAPLHAVVAELFGETVLPYEGEQFEWLETALDEALGSINREGVQAKRVNEVGNAVENHVLAALEKAGFNADRPRARSGHRRSAGYPDLEASRGADAFYLEIKTYNPATENSSQRTFYLSPSKDPKVTHPAFHLLVAFAMEPAGDNLYFAKSARLVDLHSLPVSLKIEYNASNRELYGEADAQILSIRAEEASQP